MWFFLLRPYVCLPCNEFFQTKNELTQHLTSHEEQNKKDSESEVNEDSSSSGQENNEASTKLVELPNGTKIELTNIQNTQVMPIEKMRMLLAILLKRISTPARLRKLGYGTKLIDTVLAKSIENSGRKAVTDPTVDIREALKANIETLLDWTIPREFMERFREEKKTVEEILEELTS